MMRNLIPRKLGQWTVNRPGDFSIDNRPLLCRVPEKKNESLPSLSDLGVDLITIIIDLLCDDSPASANALAYVSSFYYHATRYRQHREVCVTISKRTDEAAFQDRLAQIEERGLLSAIQHVKVHIKANDKQKCSAAMVKALGKMVGLRDLEWLYERGLTMSTSIPNQLISLLELRPQVRLHAGVSPPPLGHPRLEHNIEYNLYRLETSKNLHSFQMRFTYRRAKTCLLISPCVKHVLISCPRLRKLTIDFNTPHGGSYRLSDHYVGFGFVDGERPPALEELHLDSYVFGHEGRCVRYPGKGSELDYWVETFDWSMLRSLHTRELEFAIKVAPKLISLREASIYGYRNATQAFYQILPVALDTIIVQSFDGIGVEALLRHGRCLRALNMADAAWKIGDAVDASTLLKIREGCPHIKDLALDIDRNGGWPYEMLDILAGFPQLRSLAIRFHSGTSEKLIQPYVTYSAVRHLTSYIHSRRSSTMKSLRQLTIMTSSVFNMGYRRPKLWKGDPDVTYVCQFSERDDDEGKGSFTVRCPHLSEEENRQLANGLHDTSSSINSNLRFKIAQQGPIAWDWK